MGAVEEETTEQEMAVEEDGDEYGLRRGFRSKYLLKERSLVDSRLDDIISNGCVSDPSSVNRIRSIVIQFSSVHYLFRDCFFMTCDQSLL